MWQAPPETHFPGIVPYQDVIACSAEAKMLLIEVRAFPQGCLLDLTAVARRPQPPSPPWLAPRDQAFNVQRPPQPGEPLDPELLRCGVALPDGRTATTIESSRLRHPHQAEPDPPVLIADRVRGSTADQRQLYYQLALWLWPLPPANLFELVVEWPAYGIPETHTRIDGAAIAEAATRSGRYWPDNLH